MQAGVASSKVAGPGRRLCARASKLDPTGFWPSVGDLFSAARGEQSALTSCARCCCLMQYQTAERQPRAVHAALCPPSLVWSSESTSPAGLDGNRSRKAASFQQHPVPVHQLVSELGHWTTLSDALPSIGPLCTIHRTQHSTLNAFAGNLQLCPGTWG